MVRVVIDESAGSRVFVFFNPARHVALTQLTRDSGPANLVQCNRPQAHTHMEQTREVCLA